MDTCFRNSTLLSKVVFGLSILGLLLHLIGFYTISWSVRSYVEKVNAYPNGNIAAKDYTSLWKVCTATMYMFQCESSNNSASWFVATQIFETLGLIEVVAALVLIILYVFVPTTSGRRVVLILNICVCFAAAGCIILGIIIYGSNAKGSLSWSFALCTVAGIIFGICGIILVIDMVTRPKEVPQTQ